MLSVQAMLIIQAILIVQASASLVCERETLTLIPEAKQPLTHRIIILCENTVHCLDI